MKPHRGSGSQLLLTLTGSSGILVLFLPFTYDESPVSAIADRDFWRLALPFFLAVPVAAGYIRWIFTGTLSAVERSSAYLAAGISACITLSLYLDSSRPSGIRDWVSVFVPILALVAGGLAVRNGRTEVVAAVVCMQVAYVANSLLCLTSFVGQWQAGAYVTLFPTLSYVAQIAVAHRRNRDREQATGPSPA